METKTQRQRAVAFALTLTENTPLSPTAYERMLLDAFVRGELTLEQVGAHLDKQQAIR